MTNTPFSGQYFRDNPEKVLGEITTHSSTGKQITDQFGKPKSEVRGTLKKAIQRMSDIRSAMVFEHVKPGAVTNVSNSNPKIEKILKKTEEERAGKQQRKGGCEEGLQCLGEVIKEQNQRIEYKTQDGETHHYTIPEEEIKVWITYQTNKGVYDKATILANDWGKYYVEVTEEQWRQWWEAGLSAYNGQEWIPESTFYSGNIYAALSIMQGNREAIETVIGEEGYQKQVDKMNAAKPVPLLITKDEKRRLYLSPFDKIWDGFKIQQIENGISARDEGGNHVFYFFSGWLYGLPKEDFVFERKQTNARDIVDFWLTKSNFPRGVYSEPEKAAIRRNTTLVGQMLFDRFLVEQILEQDKVKIAGLWNSLRNNYAHVAYHRIPVGFTVNRSFKGGKLGIRPAQREGVAFMAGRGTGIVGFDVGVGKTLTAILGIMDGMEKGLFKRPMIVVPQKVYHKWIAEISGVRAEKPMTIKGKAIKSGEIISEGILPHLSVNDYYNLGSAHIGKATKSGVTIQVGEYSITMVTYEGLEAIGFSKETEEQLGTRLLEALSQGESGRSRAIVETQAEGWIDTALKDTKVNIDQMGIDAIIVDEAHNFRNLFMDVKADVGSDGEREKKNFFSGSSSAPSNRAVKLFMLNAYVQYLKNRRNTFGLTATPFTNRATEIYSMLSLYDYEGMKDFDCYNLAQFCSTFIDETLEDAWTAAGKFETKPVIRGYNNLPTLQALVSRSILYKTGEDANIHRPEKVILPLKTDEKGVPLAYEHIVDTMLPPSPAQTRWLKEAAMFADNGRFKESILAQHYPTNRRGDIDGRTLIAMNVARAATFSPYAVRYGTHAEAHPAEVSPDEFIKNSPKLLYSCECIRTVRDHHKKANTPMSGQIIYSDRGKEWFGHIKEYLVKKVGFDEKEVEIFHAGVSPDKRERIKEGFLEGKVKVIIGTSTMREGVDLQKNGSVIYVCYLDWNPTDLHQLMGRIWRFGNKFGFVRIVVPLIENSADIFTWQKLSEKMARLNSIWAKADGTKAFEDSELNAEELKKGLINDPEAIVKYEVQQEVELLQSEIALADAAIKQLTTVKEEVARFSALSDTMQLWVREAKTEPRFSSYHEETRRRNAESLDKLLEQYEEEPDKEKALMKLIKGYGSMSADSYTKGATLDSYRKTRDRLKQTEEKVLARHGLTVFDDFSPVRRQYEERVAKLQEQVFLAKSDDNFDLRLKLVTAEKEKERANSRSVQYRVEQFTRLNYLLDCLDGVHTCDIYGRVSEIKTGQVVEVDTKVEVKVEEAYNLSVRLGQFMPKAQKKLVLEEIIPGEEGAGYIQQVLKPLEEQVSGIPVLYATESVPAPEKLIYAHFFIGDSDWYIAEWDGKDTLFGYAVLGGDTYNAEWGYTSLKEITTAKARKFGTGVELDFFWKIQPFSALKLADHIEYPDYDTPEANNDLENAIEALRLALEFSEGQQKTSLKDAIAALETALEFA